MLKAVLLLPFKPFIIAGKAYWKFLDELGVECSSGYHRRNYKPPTTRLGKAWDRFTTVLIYAPCYFVTTVFNSDARFIDAIDRQRFGFYKIDKHKHGFTLVEMAIVLVIIGLIVGGIVVGKELLQGAQLRAQISQIDQLKTTINVFKMKYNCLPGDCSNAYNFFGSTCGANNTANHLGCNGNGDGNLDLNGSWWLERARLWAHLGFAQLISGNHAEGQTPEYLSYLQSSFSSKGYVASISNGAFEIGAPFGGSRMLNSLFTANQAKSIDVKIDDGVRASGKIQADWGNDTGVGASCQGGASGYTTNPDWVDTPGCYMVVLGVY